MTTWPIKFRVYGEPRPAGSKRAFAHRVTGKIIVTDSSGSKGTDWRHNVKAAALDAYRGTPLLGPLTVDVTFVRVRPSTHFNRKGLVKDSYVSTKPETRPDATKLWRAVEDACTGIVWRDDSQITLQTVRKVYGDQPGVIVEVRRDDTNKEPGDVRA